MIVLCSHLLVSVEKLVTVCDSPYTAAEGTYAIVVCTEWDEFIVRSYFVTNLTQLKPFNVSTGFLV